MIGERKNIKHSKSAIGWHESYLKRRLNQSITNISKLYQEIQEKGYKSSYATVYRYIKALVNNKSIIKRSSHVNTTPGKQAQVDWGSFGRIIINGKTRQLYAFVYILGYSRMMYVEFTARQDIKTLQECHMHAFHHLGIPETIVYDNMKTVVLRRKKTTENTSENIYFNPSFSNFAQYYGFNIYLCHPYWPREKGKVEAGIKYLRNNFMQGRRFQKDFSSLEEINKQIKKWLDTVAHVRIHGTTQKRPLELWNQEKPYLRFPEGYPNYQTAHFEVRYSTKDGAIQYHSSWYEVPMEYARRKLFVTELNNNGIPMIDIYHDNSIIGRYCVSTEKRQWIILDQSLIQHPPKKENSKPRTMRIVVKTKKMRKNHYPNIVIAPRAFDYYNRFIISRKHE